MLQQIRFVMASLDSGDIRDIPFDELWNTQPSDGVWVADRSVRATNLQYNTNPIGDDLNNISIFNTRNKRKIQLSVIDRNYIIKNRKAFKMAVRGSNSLYFPIIQKSIFIPIDISEDNLDMQEFRFLEDDENFINGICNKGDLIVRRVSLNRTSPFIKRISVLERLKETSVLLGYTRISKDSKSWYDVGAERVQQLTPYEKKPFNNPEVTWMPAVEAFGEGIFFEIDIENIDIPNQEIFIHSLCHITMKEMEFQCGYPLTSLREKIYIDNENSRAGFIIYTISGSEGSFGGLISLVRNNKILDLIERGANRAKHCSNDPICEHDNDAHCYACLDIPETSCTSFNRNLNRSLFNKIYH